LICSAMGFCLRVFQETIPNTRRYHANPNHACGVAHEVLISISEGRTGTR
jgi:hypothetical protein